MAKKQINEYANIIFGNKAKKPIDNEENTDIVETKQEKKEEEVKKVEDIKEFNPNLRAYVPFYNSKIKKYEMITVAIDTDTNRTELFREVKSYDNEPRAIMEMQKLYAQDLSARLRKKMNSK